MDTFTRGTAELAPDVRIHYVTAGTGPGTILLIHGYPQTHWQWRHVLVPLAEAGFRVIAPDYRGAGKSSRPTVGYDKHTLAGDLHDLAYGHLGVRGPLAVVGHDIGSMVAYAFARRFPRDVSHLSLSEAPLPGTLAYAAGVANPKLAGNPLWHFYFHNAGDSLAEALTAGRERLYLDAAYDRLAFDPEALRPADRERYAQAFASTGGMRAGFELYRAFDHDSVDNLKSIAAQGRLKMPVLAMAGEHSPLAAITPEMIHEVARRPTIELIPAAGHWIAEENPTAVLDALLRFLRASD